MALFEPFLLQQQWDELAATLRQAKQMAGISAPAYAPPLPRVLTLLTHRRRNAPLTSSTKWPDVRQLDASAVP